MLRFLEIMEIEVIEIKQELDTSYRDWGIEKFVEEIEKAIGYKLQDGLEAPVVASFENRNHFGINRQ